jgi:hypothetical protein
MTDKEHRMLVMMFSIHLGMVGELINVLRESGTLKTGDQAQIWNIALQEAGKRELFSATSDMYKKVAASCGIEIGSLEP